MRPEASRRERIVEALEAAFEHGRGHVAVELLDEAGQALGVRRFSSTLHCADCDIDYRDPIPNSFSFNSPAGACESCRGFGRSMGIDFGLVPLVLASQLLFSPLASGARRHAAEVVDHGDVGVFPLRLNAPHQTRADEAGPSGDEQSHLVSSLSFR